ncbi:MAG: hypothetical protein KDK07_20075 [Bauldia sp.]|nr:hypothetical protein [Bauldia sp.]
MPAEVRSTLQKRDDTGQIRHGAEWLAIWSDPESLKSDDQKRREAEERTTVERWRKSVAASARSLAGEPDLEVLFAPGRDGGGRIFAPSSPYAREELPVLRGVLDGKAACVRFNNPRIHHRLRPADADSARIFDVIEEARCHGRLARLYPGVEENLVASQAASLRAADLMNAHLAALIPLEQALRMVLRDTFCQSPEPSVQTAGFRMWDRWLRERHAADFRELAALTGDQEAFARRSLAFMSALFAELPSKGRGKDRRAPSELEPGQADDAGTYAFEDIAGGDVMEPGDQSDIDVPRQLIHEAGSRSDTAYRVFCTDHDRFANAEDLVDRAELERARRRLDEIQAAYRKDTARLAARLQRRLLAQQSRRWEFDLDEGLIDASRLDRVILSPGFASAYKMEAESSFRETLVTILIDNSGSMRGRPAEIACVSTDILSAALERCGISTEILGFTTRSWKGGESARTWRKSGRPEDPGRLNDLLHIIYKDAERPLRRARNAICAMLSNTLLKENVDGEALLWAARRMLARPEPRKLLIVLSDGAPIDQATIENNADKRILDTHLRQVISWLTSETDIDLAAIGIRHDVSQYYSRSIRIDATEDLASAMIELIDSQLE